MLQYNCIIIEDEPLAAEILKDYISQIPWLTLKAICTNAVYATEMLQKHTIDLIFLDIHLPRIKGFQFLDGISNRPLIIITSAYHEYALKGYEYNVVDYLLKPIEFDRFLRAVNKLKQPAKKEIVDLPANEQDFILINIDRKKYKLFLKDIVYIESLKEYVKIFTTENKLLTKLQIGQIETLLTPDKFLRIHRSYIVAVDKLIAFNTTEVKVGNVLLPIGRLYKKTVVNILENKK